MARDEPQINLRMPADLKARLEQAASENRRSTTAEIMARLEESFGAAAKAPDVDEHTFDLFADTVAGKVVQALDEREKRKKPRGT